VHRLSNRDVLRAFDVVVAAAAGQNSELFTIEVVDAFTDAVRADKAAYVEWRFGDAECFRVSRSDEDPSFKEALCSTCASYPLRDVDHAGAREPLRITDVASSSTFRQSPFYRAYMRPLGLEHELKLWLPAPAGHSRYFEFERGPGRNFSERDRAMLSLVRPHLTKLRDRWERRPRAPSLTDRELDILALVAQGLMNRQVARHLFISSATVRTHLENVYDKLGVRTRAGAVSAAFRLAS
jgi:DNA-binding CsgD family transcriptional regulator